MHKWNRSLFIRLTAPIVLIGALLIGAFSHTAFQPTISAPNGYDDRAFAAQFVLPDGTLPVLCDRSTDGKPHRSSAVPCEFCHIASGCIVAGEASHGLDAPLVFTDFDYSRTPEYILVARTWRIGTPTRGSPLV